MSNVFDVVLVGFYWMVCCLPVVTIGAASTAAMSVLLNDYTDSSITRMFFASFKSNFKQATLVWLALLVMCIFLVANFFFCKLGYTNETMRMVIRGISLFVLMVVLITTSLIFPLISKFKVTFSQAFYNVFALFGKYPLHVFIMVLQLGLIALSFYLFSAFGFVTASVGLYVQSKTFLKMIPEYSNDSPIIEEDLTI